MHRSLRLSILFLAIAFVAVVISKRQTLSQASSNCYNQALGDGSFIPTNIALFENQPVTPLLAELPQPSQTVLGAANSDKWIEVDLSDQTIKAHQGNSIILESKVSSGKFAKTPVGEFRIWAKFKYIKMEGGKKGTNTYYYLPNVPSVMFFYNDKTPKWRGYGLHGAYWHNNFGQPMSHGCVNLPVSFSAQLFNWADPQLPQNRNMFITTSPDQGTRIVIHD